MKKCPTCEKTFDDNMKFCQTDGTPLVEVQDAPAEPEDPYKTTVAQADDLPIPQQEDPYQAAVGGSSDKTSAEPETPKPEPEPPAEEEFDPLKTMVATDSPSVEPSEPEAEEPASEAKTLDAPAPTPFSATSTEPEKLEEETPASAPSPEPPQFSEPDLSPPSMADSSSDLSGSTGAEEETAAETPGKPGADSPPPSPFDSPSTEDSSASGDLGAGADDSVSSEPVAPPTSQNVAPPTSDGSEFKDQGNEPIPSPFDESMPGYKPPTTPMPPYKEAETKAEALNTPFAEEVAEDQGTGAADWMNSPMPGGELQNQEFGSNAPFQAPAAGVEGDDKTMAIIALVCGILSIPCCGFLTGIPAMIVGYMAKNKAEGEPAIYGGRGLALAGIITGAIGSFFSIVVLILQIIFGVLGSI